MGETYTVCGPIKSQHHIVDALIRNDPSRKVCDGFTTINLSDVRSSTILVILVGDEVSEQLAQEALQKDREKLAIVLCCSRFENKFDLKDPRIYANTKDYVSSTVKTAKAA